MEATHFQPNPVGAPRGENVSRPTKGREVDEAGCRLARYSSRESRRVEVCQLYALGDLAQDPLKGWGRRLGPRFDLLREKSTSDPLEQSTFPGTPRGGKGEVRGVTTDRTGGPRTDQGGGGEGLTENIKERDCGVKPLYESYTKKREKSGWKRVSHWSG